MRHFLSRPVADSGWARCASFFTVALVILACGAALAPAAHAQDEAKPGTYRCLTVEIDHQAERCQIPSLTLKNDGSYEIWGENGTYEVVQDRWLVLSHSKRRGLGYLAKPGEIIFEYHVGKQLWRVTFERESSPSRGFFEG